MKIALWIIGLLALPWALLTRHLFVAADRPGDDFGAGTVFWLAALLLAVLVISWLILAAIHWWPK